MTFSAWVKSAVDLLKAYFQRCLDFDTLTDLDNFSQIIHNNLTALYSSLLFFTVFLTAGLYLHFEEEIGGQHTMLGVIGSVFLLVITSQQMEVLRGIFLYVAAFFVGASWIPYTQPYLNFIDPSYIIAVLLGNIVCFSCFWRAARRAHGRHRFDIYFHGVVDSCVLTGIWTVIAFFYFRFYLVLPTFFYLLFLAAYVVAYSQEMVVRARAGEVIDSVDFGMRFFSDSLGVSTYVLFLIVMFVLNDEDSISEIILTLRDALAERISASKHGPNQGKQKRHGRKR